MKKTEAIKNFLTHHTHSDLADLYSEEMETQVIVAQDDGEIIEGEYRGRKWRGFTDGITTWKSFRIPWNAGSEPEFNDSEIQFDISEHAEGIGLTGWNWKQRKPVFVAFDFDGLIGHKQGLSQDELDTIAEAVSQLPYVTLRKSTSGNGLHVYVFIDPQHAPRVNNHTEHAALARAILGKLSSETGQDLSAKVDACGGNVWVWHRKMSGTDGLELVKQGEPLTNIPINWHDHVSVVTKQRRRVKPILVSDEDAFNNLVGRANHVPLDETHTKLIRWLEENNCQAWFDTDHHLLVSHTYDLARAHKELGLRGIFNTVATGKEAGFDHNCFCFPMRDGVWIVRRYTKGMQESSCWEVDGSGWTYAYFNREPDLHVACQHFGAVEHPNGYYVAREANVACNILALLGIDISIPESMAARVAHLKKHKDGRIIVELERHERDDPQEMQDWVQEKKYWKKILRARSTQNPEPEVGDFDDLTRHLVTESGGDYGWMLNSAGEWRSETKDNCKSALLSLGLKSGEVNIVLGNVVLNPWVLVNKPFEPEYLGDRRWNRNSPQLKYKPKEVNQDLNYPTWNMILNHVGKDLDFAVKESEWCQTNRIVKGADYLKCWIAALFQQPRESLPYLFLYGPEASGKSLLHEALSLLVTSGYVKASSALLSQGGFNGELDGAVICAVEEVNLQANKAAAERIKEWTTADQLSIHKKGHTPYMATNTTHWIQAANDISYCPVFPGDTRIVVIHVNEVEKVVPKRVIFQSLQKEATDFITEILNLEVPASPDRMIVPVIETEQKRVSQSLSESELDTFLRECCYDAPGHVVALGEFANRFYEYLDGSSIGKWSKSQIGKAITRLGYPKGRSSKLNSGIGIGNISFEPPEQIGKPLHLVGDYLKES